VALDQLRWRALRRDSALVHDHEPVAKLFCLVHVMRCNHQRDALALQLVEAIPDEVPCLRIETGRRLIQDQQIWFGNQRPCDREPTFHAPREALDAVTGSLAELRELQQSSGSLFDLSSRYIEVAP